MPASLTRISRSLGGLNWFCCAVRRRPDVRIAKTRGRTAGSYARTGGGSFAVRAALRVPAPRPKLWQRSRIRLGDEGRVCQPFGLNAAEQMPVGGSPS
jgi:hypothetical protein